MLCISTQPLLAVREHCRSIGEVILPDGERRPWRWYDPEVLRAILPTLLAGQLDEVFALGQSIVIPAAAAWTWLAMQDGVLATDTRPLMARLPADAAMLRLTWEQFERLEQLTLKRHAAEHQRRPGARPGRR